MARGPHEWAQLLSIPRLSQSGHPQWVGLGIHPWWIAGNEEGDGDKTLDQDLRELRELLLNHPHIQIGEIGLDGARPDHFELQTQAFDRQMALAEEFDRRVAIHLVQAYGPLDQVLRKYPGVRGLIHGYGGSVEWMKQKQAQGWCFSFGPEILEPNRIRSRQAFIACENYLLESDDRLMNDTEWMAFAHAAAELKGVELFELIEETKKRFAFLLPSTEM